MSNSEKKYGRTLYDVIAEHPKKTLAIFLSVLALVVALILLNVPFKIGSLEVGVSRQIIHDTLVRHDTIVITKYVTKDNPNAKRVSEVKADVKSYNQQGGQTANQITNTY